MHPERGSLTIVFFSVGGSGSADASTLGADFGSRLRIMSSLMSQINKSKVVATQSTSFESAAQPIILVPLRCI